MAPAPTVSARVLSLIAAAAQARGVSLARQLHASGIADAVLADPDARVPLATEEALWEQAATACEDPQFGLHAAQSLRPGQFDVLDYAVRTAPTLRESLRRLARYNRLVHDLATFDLQPRGRLLRVEHRLGATRPACPQAAEFTLASLAVIGRQLSPRFAVHAVEFAHAALGDPAAYEQVFGVLPAFSRDVNAVTLDDAMLDAPLPAADPALSRIVTRHAEHLLAALPPAQVSVASRVRQEIAAQLATGPLSLPDAARRLHLSERSLQRQLLQEGVRFAELVDQVRRELALRYVADRGLAIGEVAYLLGFSEPSPFHRAFKRWTGRTPAAARAAAR
ncbi:AraC family transcriptional regulator [Ramlibacter sp. USB13]|uniref:AraC family transcriptional regulator n=1 Tax=Ramlibacter cellulosilyticus TaxID=2764187 RepID=A0A923MNX2_9BURK|nr:AraC family transcriptional regulator [Ramlibacter cellulosilyticus]MBC5781534.1 AraC family transcriptional regulator [Ramlibacter cellulosilyticus]